VIVTATILVFPDRVFILENLIESGRLEMARKYIQKYTTEHPDDVLLFIISSNIHLLEGRADKAIETLKPFLDKDNVSKPALLRLAQLYEWERNPQMALVVLERTSELFPDDPYVWNRLISYYRYLGQMNNEVRAIIALSRINQQVKQKNTILSIIDRKIFEIAGLHTNHPDQMTTYLLSKLNVIRKNLADELADKTVSKKIKEESVEYSMTRIIELYVYVDMLEEIKPFARELDHRLHTKFKYRMTLMTVMRWADLDSEAVAYLWELHENEPKQTKILEQIVGISRENGEIQTAMDALQKLLNIHPTSEDYGQKLAQLYIEQEKYSDAFQIYQQFMHRFSNQKYAALLLDTANSSDQKALMLEAVEAVQPISNKSLALIKQLVEIYLSLEKLQLAYDTGLQYLSSVNKPEKDFLKKMLEIAIWTTTPKNILSSIAHVQRYFPDDSELTIQCADAFLAINRSQDAFLLYGKIIHSKHDNRSLLIKYMDIASYTQNPDMMTSAALTTAKLSKSDYLVIEKSTQLLQWTNQPGRAYDILEKWLQINGGSVLQVQKLLSLATESGERAKIKKAVSLMKTHVQRDPTIYLTIAKEAITSGATNEAIFAYEAYLRQKKNDTDIQRKLAQLYVWEGQTDKAFQVYRQLFEKFPKDPTIRKKLIEIAGWTKNESSIAFLVAEKANANPSDYSLQLKAGEAYIASGQTQESIEFFERALTIEPSRIELRRKLAQYYGWLDQYNDQIRLLESIQQFGRLTQSERILVAQAAMNNKQPEKAISLLEPLFKRQLLSETSGIILAHAFQQKGQNAKSFQIYKQLSQQYQDDPRFLSKMGNEILWMQNQVMALSFFKKALTNDPNNLDALKGCAEIYAGKNKTGKAIHFFKRYLKLNPDNYEVRYQLAELFYSKGQKQNAFKHYQKALTLIDRHQRQHR